MQIDPRAIFVEMWTLLGPVGPKNGIPKQPSLVAPGVALQGPHGDASAHESLHHPDGGKVQKCHSQIGRAHV